MQREIIIYESPEIKNKRKKKMCGMGYMIACLATLLDMNSFVPVTSKSSKSCGKQSINLWHLRKRG
jgi:hypothetical protein